MRKAILLIILICSMQAHSSPASFMKRGYEGWFWYEEVQKSKDKEQAVQFPEGLTPTQEKHFLRRLQEESLDLATKKPTVENVTRYIRIQKFALDRAKNFTDTYTKVMQTNPELSESTKYPTSRLGNQIWQKNRAESRKKVLKNAPKQYGLFYFYRSNCMYCKEFVPTVKHFQKKWGFEMIPVTLDGGIHPELPNTQRNGNLAQQLQVKDVPALYLLNTKTKEIIPMSFGIFSIDSLEEKAAARISESQNKEKHEK